MAEKKEVNLLVHIVNDRNGYIAFSPNNPSFFVGGRSRGEAIDHLLSTVNDCLNKYQKFSIVVDSSYKKTKSDIELPVDLKDYPNVELLDIGDSKDKDIYYGWIEKLFK